MPPPSANPIQKPRRFYQSVGTLEQEDGFAVGLDGRVARTPAGAPLLLPTQALAEVLMTEWADQHEVIDFAAMGATRLAFTALDGGKHAAMADEVASYAASDLLCYFADGPDALLQREVAHWEPVLSWAEAALGLRFVRAKGVVHQPQPPETVERVRRLADELDRFALTGLVFAAGLFGSAILAFGLQRGRLSGDAAFDLSRLDEAHQEERWGVDAEAAARTERLRSDAQMLQRWFGALSTAADAGYPLGAGRS